jgi:hypothetical protein
MIEHHFLASVDDGKAALFRKRMLQKHEGPTGKAPIAGIFYVARDDP